MGTTLRVQGPESDNPESARQAEADLLQEQDSDYPEDEKENENERERQAPLDPDDEQ